MNIDSLYSRFKETTGPCTDTRNILANSMFFALKGSNFDANEYALQALKNGCKYAVVDDPNIESDDNLILVKNVLQTMQQLANFHREQFNIPVIGLTGSNGKTTTKELITEVLKQKFKVHSTVGNFNNHIGVPLTLLKMPLDTEIAVIEMGANGPNDIAELCAIANPNYGLITNIGKAHLEGFGGFEGVIKAKSQLYEHIDKAEGKLFINIDDQILCNQAKNIPAYSYSSLNDDADIKGTLGPDSLLISFHWSTKKYKSDKVSTQLTGTYNLPNLLAAVAIGNYFSVNPEKISSALSEYCPENNRSQVHKSERNTLVLDAYNANPTSTENAVRSFAAINSSSKFFILGDMLELGEATFSEHLFIIQLIAELELNGIFVGQHYSNVIREKQLNYSSFENASLANSYLKTLNLQNNLILVKGSRGIKLESLVSDL